MITKDRFFSVVMMLIVAMLFYESGNIPQRTSWQPHGSALFPRILLGIIAILSVIIFIKSMVKDGFETQFNVKSFLVKINEKSKSIGLFVLFGTYALLLPHAGYLLATLCFMAASQALLMGFNTLNKIITILLTTFGVVPTIYLIFRHGLKIWLP
ncbi:tripartite tricarboxylate transporter TctB family protein [Halomonas sp. MA07-2]|uniref:tripartite tricarboxylate transporter TctB family protein n=1 Tax=Halomonas sp. MA07-2 TaxID=3440841 RepID=UPI003EEB6934